MRTAKLAILALAGALTAFNAAAAAKPKPPVKKPSAEKIVAPPPEPLWVVSVSGPRSVVLKPMTPAETLANTLWTLRAGLNVAALQCQFSPFLGTVKTYNDLLKHHSAELAKAQQTMLAHFKRYDKARAASSFDQYATKTYNSFSTLDAQYSFCEAASVIGRNALMTSKGGFSELAATQGPLLRASLVPQKKPVLDATPVELPPIELASGPEPH